MDTTTFLWHAAAAALMGTAIGFERQWGQHPAGLRTNSLVAFGACLFVSLPHLLGGSPTASHLAGQVVTGVGFLGGGVILREGLNIRGLNTAATMWCSAAVGALTGAGLVAEALAGTVGVLALNLGLRPVAKVVDRRVRRAVNVETTYKLRATCQAGHEGAVRAALLNFFHDHTTMAIQGMSTVESGSLDKVCVAADIFSERRDDRAMEDLTVLINDDPKVMAVSWERNTPK